MPNWRGYVFGVRTCPERSTSNNQLERMSDIWRAADYLPSMLGIFMEMKRGRRYDSIVQHLSSRLGILRDGQAMQKWWICFLSLSDVVISFSDTFSHQFPFLSFLSFLSFLFFLSCHSSFRSVFILFHFHFCFRVALPRSAFSTCPTNKSTSHPSSNK